MFSRSSEYTYHNFDSAWQIMSGWTGHYNGLVNGQTYNTNEKN